MPDADVSEVTATTAVETTASTAPAESRSTSQAPSAVTDDSDGVAGWVDVKVSKNSARRAKRKAYRRAQREGALQTLPEDAETHPRSSEHTQQQDGDVAHAAATERGSPAHDTAQDGGTSARVDTEKPCTDGVRDGTIDSPDGSSSKSDDGDDASSRSDDSQAQSIEGDAVNSSSDDDCAASDADDDALQGERGAGADGASDAWTVAAQFESNVSLVTADFAMQVRCAGFSAAPLWQTLCVC